MIQTLTLQYENKTINLINSTNTNNDLVFKSSEWEVQITNRDKISFQVTIFQYPENTINIPIRAYHCFCDIYNQSVNILKAYNRITDKEVDIKTFSSFLEPAINDIFSQLKKELLYPFRDKNYLERFICHLLDKNLK